MRGCGGGLDLPLGDMAWYHMKSGELKREEKYENRCPCGETEDRVSEPAIKLCIECAIRNGIRW